MALNRNLYEIIYLNIKYKVSIVNAIIRKYKIILI